MLQPLQDKVVLKLNKEEVTKGGIILSSNSQNKSQMATVISVGPGIIINGNRIPMDVKEKDIVFVEKNAGIQIEYEGEEYLIVGQNEILAIIS